MMERVGKYITNYIKGKTPKVLLPDEEADTMPYLSPDYLRGVATPEFYAKQDNKSIVVDNGEVIVLWDGSNAGEILISKKGVLASTMTMLQFDETQIDKAYFGYSFQNLEYILKAKTAGSGIPHADKGVISKLEFYKPSLPEQTAIAAILSKVDESIAAVQRSIAAAERLKKSLMQNLLTGRMKPDGTLRKEDEFYVDEKFGRVPKGWEVKRLKDICLNSGDYGANASAIDYDETKPRFIRITDIDDFGQLLDEGKASMAGDNTTKYMLEEDDFLFARTGDTVGKSLLYKKEMGPAVYAGYLIKFTFDRNLVLPDYFDLIAKSEFFEAFKIAMKRVGAKPNINSREYCSFKFLLPSDIKEQKEIFGRFAHIDKTQKEKQNKIAVLERLKKSLMQNLLTGRVRVLFE